MRTGTFAAGVAAMVMTHGAPLAASAMVPSAASGTAEAGGVLGVSARPGARLSRNFRLRLDAWTAPPAQRQVNPAPRPKRLGTMLDFYPDEEGGLHLSAGMRMLSAKGKQGWSGLKGSRMASILYAPAAAATIGGKGNLSARSPAVTAGWTARLSERASFGIEAGALFEHGHSSGGLGLPRAAGATWSRVDPVAQMAFALRF